MLSQVSLDVYRFAVSRPGWTAEDASEALGYTSRAIDAAIAELTSRCLLLAQATDCPSYTAVSPDVALAELVDPDERTLLELRSRINARRREMAALTPAYVEARKRLAADSSVEVVEDQD